SCQRLIDKVDVGRGNVSERNFKNRLKRVKLSQNGVVAEVVTSTRVDYEIAFGELAHSAFIRQRNADQIGARVPARVILTDGLRFTRNLSRRFGSLRNLLQRVTHLCVIKVVLRKIGP